MTKQNGVDRQGLLEYMKHHVVLGDGAMATFLHQMGVPVRTCYEELCLSQPDLIAKIHKAYVTAGATLLQTNTFSAHRAGLARYGMSRLVRDINHAAVRIARDAAGARAYVVGCIGSIMGLEPQRVTMEADDEASISEQFREQASALLEESVDGILLETFADLSEMLIAIDVVRSLTELPIIANLSPHVIGVTRDGIPVEEAFARMRQAGADVVGLNCNLGPSGILRTYEGVPALPTGLYAAVPNAGMLHQEEGEYAYTGNSEYFADMAVELVKEGVHLIGGCCGTTPDYIRSVRDRLAQLSMTSAPATSAAVPVRSAPPVNLRETQVPVHPTELSRSLSRETILDKVGKEITIICELDPPKTLETERFLSGARALADAGVDYVTLADNSLGSVRISNVALASILKNMGIEPLVHVACRDRNLIGQQSHLMGLNVLDIHHILLITGDPSRFGDLPGATSVFDVSSIELTRMVKRLNQGVAFSGQSTKQSATFVVGTSFNPHVLHFDKAVERLRRKVEAGADFIMTQPIFDERMFETLARVAEDLSTPMFAGVMPLVSARNANFLHNEVPGIQIPQTILHRMNGTSTDTAVPEGLAIARSLIDTALTYFRGIYLITPFLRYDLTVELARHARCVECRK